MLVGGAGSNIFAFTKVGGWHIITDFIDCVDKIQIAADTGIANYNRLKLESKSVLGEAIYTMIDWDSSDRDLPAR